MSEVFRRESPKKYDKKIKSLFIEFKLHPNLDNSYQQLFSHTLELHSIL